MLIDAYESSAMRSATLAADGVDSRPKTSPKTSARPPLTASRTPFTQPSRMFWRHARRRQSAQRRSGARRRRGDGAESGGGGGGSGGSAAAAAACAGEGSDAREVGGALGFVVFADRDEVDQELGGVGLRRALVAEARKILECAVGGSVVDHAAARREQQRVVEVAPDRRARLVERRDGGDLALARERADQADDALGLVGVEAGGRLVGEERLRLAQQLLAHRQPPALAARDAAVRAVADARVAHRPEPEALEQPLDARRARRRALVGALQRRRRRQHLAHGQHAKLRVVLREQRHRAVLKPWARPRAF